jgi:hypothetical protein
VPEGLNGGGDLELRSVRIARKERGHEQVFMRRAAGEPLAGEPATETWRRDVALNVARAPRAAVIPMKTQIRTVGSRRYEAPGVRTRQPFEGRVAREARAREVAFEP